MLSKLISEHNLTTEYKEPSNKDKNILKELWKENSNGVGKENINSNIQMNNSRKSKNTLKGYAKDIVDSNKNWWKGNWILISNF